MNLSIALHPQDITALDFHPSWPILVSGGKDCTVKLFDFSKSTVKKSAKSIQEVSSIRFTTFHPCGDFLLVATEHPTCESYLLCSHFVNDSFLLSGCVCFCSLNDTRTVQLKIQIYAVFFYQPPTLLPSHFNGVLYVITFFFVCFIHSETV